MSAPRRHPFPANRIEYVRKNLATGQVTRESYPDAPSFDLGGSLLTTPGFQGEDTQTPIAPYSIIGDDGRSEVVNYKSAPNSRICYLNATFPNGAVKRGTAWMFKKDAAATAGHCLYSAADGGWATKVEIWPGRNNSWLSGKPYGSATAVDIALSDSYINSGNTDYDYGLIKLNKDIGNSCGWFSYAYNGGTVN